MFAALEVVAGKIIGACRQRHRASEFRAFRDPTGRSVPAELDPHLVLGNASAGRAPTLRRWPAQRPRYHLHFTPTSTSWLTMVEGWFALLVARQMRRGTVRSIRALEPAIRA